MRGQKIARAVVLALLLVLRAGAADAWIARIGGVESVADGPRDVAGDPGGDLLAAGDGAVVKYAHADGSVVWRTVLADVAGPLTRVGPVTADAAGDVIVTGSTSTPATSVDAVVVKLSGTDGHLLWRFVFDGPAHGPDYVGRAVLDAHGDVIVGGTTYLIAEDMLVVKIDGATGVERWHATVPGPGVGQDQGLAVAVDAHGDVALAGDSTVGGQDRFAVIKVSGRDGKLLWRGFAGGPDEGGQAVDVAFDPSGDVVALGAVALAATGFDVTVLKLDGATGAERWHRYFDGSAHDFDFGEGLAVDAGGNVIAVGELVNDGTRADVFAVELTSDGDEVWRSAIDGGLGLGDYARALAVVGQRVVVGAIVDDSTAGDTRFAVLGLDAATGAEAWRRVESGLAVLQGGVVHVAAGAAGAVFASGVVASPGTKDDAILLDLDAASGGALWRLVVNGTVPDDSDEARAVAVDASGDAIVTGRVGAADGAEQLTVVKLAAASGAVLWRTDVDGALHQDDVGDAVLVDAAGDVLAAGVTVDAPGLPPLDPRFPGLPPLANVRVVKLDGATGAPLWQSTPSFGGRGFPAATDLALACGDPVVAGWFGVDDYYSGAAVVRLAGETGLERWRFELPGRELLPEEPVRVEVDPLGDVVAGVGAIVDKIGGADGRRIWETALGAGAASVLALDGHGDVAVASADRLGVTKLSGVDGTVLWTAQLDDGRTAAIAIDPAGDVVLTGAVQRGGTGRVAAAKLDGSTGAVRWLRVLPGHRTGRGLALDGAGDVLVAGAVEVRPRGDDFAVVKLRGRDGVQRWRRQIDGGDRLADRAQAIALDGQRAVVAAGVFTGATSGGDLAVVGFDGRTGRYR